MYLLGELSEAEQAEWERQYFADPRAFTQLIEVENDLVDDFAHDQLPTAQRARFAQHYLANPHLVERARFAQSLQTNFLPSVTAITPARAHWSPFAFLTRPAFKFAAIAAALLLTLASFGWWRETQRLQRELAATQIVLDQEAAQRRAAETQLADERTRNAQLQNELAQAQMPNTTPAFVTLLLTASGIRTLNTDALPRLTIPGGIEQVRLQLTLPVNEYRSYHVVLQSVGGAALWQRQNLKPQRIKQGARFTFALPARLFAQGDYLLSLTGVTAQGEAEEISQSIFRVTKR